MRPDHRRAGADEVTPPRLGAPAQIVVALLVVLAVTAFGVQSVQVRRSDVAATWALLPGMPGAFWFYVWRWPPEIVGWLVLVWAATRRLRLHPVAGGARPSLLGLVLVVAAALTSFLGGSHLAWAGPVGLGGVEDVPFSPAWWWAVSGPESSSVRRWLVTWWSARRGARPARARARGRSSKQARWSAIPVLSLAFGAIALTASAVGVRDALRACPACPTCWWCWPR